MRWVFPQYWWRGRKPSVLTCSFSYNREPRAIRAPVQEAHQRECRDDAYQGVKKVHSVSH